MPTPVSLARQCLTDEAARAIDDAVSVARRRSHAQTTSLHAVSALLTSASSALLREACARARSSAYSPRLQFRALELSVGVSLDRLPTCSTKTLAEPPPISNSLMAAIKRSQANQRRQPESFYLLQQQQLQQTTSLFKVELKHLVLSILDDPIVSRVFGEAGFRSCDVKFAIIHPPVTSPSSSSSSRLLNTRCPPIFLCNLTDSDPVRKGFSFPFMGGEDENCARIGKVLVRKTGKNPVLIGVSANNALNCFVDCVPRGKKGGIEIDGLCVISIGNEVSEFVNNGGDKEKLDLKFREIGDLVKNCEGPGIVVNLGELKPLVEEDGVSGDGLSYLVLLFMDLLELYRDKLWLIGAAGSYETYMKLIARFPSIEKDLDLHLLPITSSRPSIPEFGSKSSLMGSFVPFGGFFSSSSDFKISLTGNNGFKTRCELCNKKYDEEVSSLKRGCNLSVADQYSSTLPSWLQITEIDPSKGVSTAKAKEDESIISAKIMGLQKKWDDICQTIHHTQLPKPNIGQTRTDVLTTEGSQFSPDKNQKNNKDSPPSETRSATLSPFIDKDLRSPYKQNVQRPVALKASITSVTTDLGLGTLYASTHQESKNTKNEEREKRLQNLASSISAKIDSNGKSNPSDFKSIWRELLEKVGRQEEAICTISETVSRFKNGEGKCGSSRGDIWLSFLGPDKVGKKQIASALAEVVFGSPESLISIDLSFQDGIIQSNSIFYSQGYDDVKYRGKTVVDCIAEELRKRPHSIVFLENMDKADPLAQSSLSQAIRTGKFPDSHGREISINNMIFVTASNTAKGNHNFIPQKVDIRLSEEVILDAKRWQMQILIRNIDDSLLIGAEKEIPSFISMNKRKLSDTSNSTYQDVASEMQKHPQKLSRSYLDLNLPLAEMEDDISENSEEWLDEFFEQVDEKIVLRPFDFDALADKVLKEIKKHFLKIFESGVRLEIENPAMVQIVAAAWVSDEKRAVEDWVDDVLRRSFVEARTRYCPNAQSVVKLMACEGILMEEQAPGICLPASIIIN